MTTSDIQCLLWSWSDCVHPLLISPLPSFIVLLNRFLLYSILHHFQSYHLAKCTLSPACVREWVNDTTSHLPFFLLFTSSFELEVFFQVQTTTAVFTGDTNCNIQEYVSNSSYSNSNRIKNLSVHTTKQPPKTTRTISGNTELKELKYSFGLVYHYD